MRARNVVRLLLAIALLALGAPGPVGCRRTEEPATRPPAETPPSEEPTEGGSVEPTAPQGTTSVVVYLLKDEKVFPARRDVDPTRAVAGAAMSELLEGPTRMEEDSGLSSAIPSGTRLRSIKIASGVATVDLTEEFGTGGGSASMRGRVAQVVYTLTRFSQVRSVAFRIDGEPVEALGGEGLILEKPQTRKDWEDLTPAVLVEVPLLDDAVSSPLRVTGTANVFEAVFTLELTDGEGVIVAKKRVQATSGTGTRGTFDVSLTFDPTREGSGELIASYASPKDGTRVVVAEVPLNVRE